MAWLDRSRAIGYLRLLAGANVAALLFLVLTSTAGVDRNGFLLGSDFIAFWTSGRMLHEGRNVYDAAAHIAAQRSFYASESGYTAFFYPPSFLPLCWLLGGIGYFAALSIWLLGTGSVYLITVRQWWQGAVPGAPIWLLALAFPAVPIVVTHGQTAFLIAGLIGLGAWLVPARPVLAGVMFGIATIKPQFGVLVPLALVLSGEWKVVVAAAITALAMAVSTTMLFASDIWMDWISASARAQAAMEAGAVPFDKMVSLFAAARMLGASVGAAYAVQALGLVGACIGVIALCRSRKWSPGLAAAVLAGAPLATPFALDYDLVLVGFPLLWLAGEGLRTGFASWEKLSVMLTLAAPAFARPVALHFSIPIMPFILALFFVTIIRRARIVAGAANNR